MKNIKYILITIALSLNIILVYSQTNHGTNVSGSSGAQAEPLGWLSGTANDLDILNSFSNKNIYISTYSGSLTKRMSILSSGEVGIGNFSPAYKLDVDNGDINLNTSSKGYRIAGDIILRTGGNNNDIMVGYNAGNGSMGGHYSTFMGRGAGNSVTDGGRNTFIGYQAGTSATLADSNVAIGYQALHDDVLRGKNVAVGYQALYTLHSPCTSCDGYHTQNTAVGYQALKNSDAYGGCALGSSAGYSNITGCSLIAIGEEAAYGNISGNDNIAIGEAALHNTDSLNDNIAIGEGALHDQNYGSFDSYNIAIGNDALRTNNPTSTSTGFKNNAVGHHAFFSNTTGAYNEGFGFEAGYTNQTGNYNTFIGHQAGYLSTANYNCFVGYTAGTANTSGTNNTFVGSDAGYANTTGSDNSAFGLQALGQTTTAGANTGLGYRAGYTNVTGTQNTFVGKSADASGTGSGAFTNCAAYGYGATTDASYKYSFGNSAVTVIGGPVDWTIISDGRFKINVTENVSGLDFIKRLRPITYNLDAQALDDHINQYRAPILDDQGNVITEPPLDFTPATSIVHSGFIAQEVEQASLASGFTSSIVKVPANPDGTYALTYAEFVVPLVKAVQQLDSTNEALQTQLSATQAQVTALQDQVNGCCVSQRESGSIPPNSGTIQLENVATLQLLEADPNPFSESTMIRWNIPNDFRNAVIYFYDNSGTQINTFEIKTIGQGELQVFGSKLSAGIYTYSLVVDGKLIDSKKMMKAK